jgi:hypothetical protein
MIVFCPVCNNMMCCSHPGDAGIQYICRCCGVETPTTALTEQGETPMKTHCVFSRVLKQTKAEASETLLDNPHIAMDPTLPRRQLKCFNDHCKNTEIVVLRIDAQALTYAFFCNTCKTKWTGETEL